MEKLLSWLPLLICPLMMLFCMRGMFGGKKDCQSTKGQPDLAKKLESLELQNTQLIQEVNELKNKQIPS